MFKLTKHVPEERVTILPPSAILDTFIDDVRMRRDTHFREMERLQSIIDDAKERLANHKVAHDACEAILMDAQINQDLMLPAISLSKPYGRTDADNSGDWQETPNAGSLGRVA